MLFIATFIGQQQIGRTNFDSCAECTTHDTDAHGSSSRAPSIHGESLSVVSCQKITLSGPHFNGRHDDGNEGEELEIDVMARTRCNDSCFVASSRFITR